MSAPSRPSCATRVPAAPPSPAGSCETLLTGLTLRSGPSRRARRGGSASALYRPQRRPRRWAVSRCRRWAGGRNSTAGRELCGRPSSRGGPLVAPTPRRRARCRCPFAGRQRHRGVWSEPYPDGGSGVTPCRADRAGRPVCCASGPASP